MQTSQFARSHEAEASQPCKYVFLENHGFCFPDHWIQLLFLKEMHQGALVQIREELCLAWNFHYGLHSNILKMYQGHLNCCSGDISKIRSYDKLPLPVTVLVLCTSAVLRNKQMGKSHFFLLRWRDEADVWSGSSAMETAQNSALWFNKLKRRKFIRKLLIC